MSALPGPQPNAEPPKPLLTVFRGDEQAPTDLSELLEAWREATVRLEKTHALLREEVARLNSELETKNRELARKNRMADLGEMASHVAHEVRNNLTPVTLYLSLLRRQLSRTPDALETLSKVEAGFAALEATVTDLLSFSANRQPHWSHFLIDKLVRELADSLRPQFEAQGVEIEIDVPSNTTVHADRELMRRAVLNLMLNALDVMPQGGELGITSYEGAGGFELEVADSGPGLSDDCLPRVFEPFYSTKKNGTGLGLAVVAHVAQAHHGVASAVNCPEGGAAFTIRLPNQIAEAAA